MTARRLWWAGAALAAVAVAVVASAFGGAVTSSVVTGLPDAGPVTAWGLPVARLVIDLAAATTVGCLAFVTFVLPGEERTVGPTAYRLTRTAGLAALVWACASALLLVLSLSDLLGRPLGTLSLTSVLSFAFSVSQGQALTAQVLLAGAVAVLGRVALGRISAFAALVLALAGVLPPALTGHAAGAGNHQLAVSSLAVHVLAATLWTGGLIALLLTRPRRLVADLAPRFSRVALVCFVAVAVSGVANAAVRLGGWTPLWHSAYGGLVLGKLAALLALGGIGAVHRRWSLRRLREGAPAAFSQLAAGEVVLLAATFGLAVALSRTPTPVPTNPPAFDEFTGLVGFALPPPPTFARMLGQPLPDLLILTVVVGLAAYYLAGVRRLRGAWPIARTASWLAGLVVLAAVTNLGIARYAYLLFSVHMAQHMVLTMVVPPLLVAGAPVTLALRALRPAPTGVRGPREWLLLAIHSQVARVVSHPVYALVIYVASLYGLYFSPLLSTLMRGHVGHLVMLAHFVLSGYLLVWVLVGTDPGRRPTNPPLLILVLFASMAFHAFFGVALMQSDEPVGGPWFAGVHPSWAGPPGDDQYAGGAIAWAFGEIPSVILMIVLVRQWFRADEREQRRLDRAADRAEATGEEDELARYNAFLRQANEEARRSGAA